MSGSSAPLVALEGIAKGFGEGEARVQALSDVIRVMSAGRLSPAFPRGALTQGELGAWMAGHGFEDAA